MFSKSKAPLALFRRYHFILALTFVIAILALEGWFLYLYFYKPLLATKSLVDFKERVAFESLNRSSYEQIKRFYENRNALPAINLKTVRDPFSDVLLP